MIRAAIPVAVTLCLLVVGDASPLAAEEADPPQGTFQATASAQGVLVNMTMPGAPLSNTVLDAPGPATLAVLDSVGESRAFASFPFPGENAALAPGLLRGLFGAPVPDYPFFVSSRHPFVPEQAAGSGGYELRARSSETESGAVAHMGFQPDESTALGVADSRSSVRSVPGLVAQAASIVRGFAVGPLRLGEVSSTVRLTREADGTLNRHSDLHVTGARVGDTPVAVTPKGLVVSGSEVAAADTAPIQATLAQANLKVDLLARQDSATATTAPVLRVTRTDPSGTVTTFKIGAASAAIAGAGPEPEPDAAAGGESPTASDPAPGPSPSSAAPIAASGHGLSVPSSVVAAEPASSAGPYAAGRALTGDHQLSAAADGPPLRDGAGVLLARLFFPEAIGSLGFLAALLAALYASFVLVRRFPPTTARSR